MSCPKVSVIVPMYNVEDYLRQALDSLVNQTLKDIEIICVDDCSTDGSVEILNEYAKKDSRIKVHVQKENQGQGVARNIAIEMATGEYIMFLDPDDWFDTRACEIAYNQIEKNKNDVVLFNYSSYKETEITIIIRKSQHLKSFQDFQGNSFCLKDVEDLRFRAATVWCQIYNREFINRINARFSNTRTCEDNPFYFNAIANARTVSVIPEVLYYYRLRVGSGQPYYIKHREDVFDNKNVAYEFVKNCEFSEQFLQAYIPYYWNSLVNGHISRVLKYDKSLKKDIYKKLHELAEKLNKEYPMRTLKGEFNYMNYKAFLYANNPLCYKLMRILFRIFSIDMSRTHVVLNFMGIKLKFKRRSVND